MYGFKEILCPAVKTALSRAAPFAELVSVRTFSSYVTLTAI